MPKLLLPCTVRGGSSWPTAPREKEGLRRTTPDYKTKRQYGCQIDCPPCTVHGGSSWPTAPREKGVLRRYPVAISTQAPPPAMIYIFRIQAEPWIKIGYTQHNNPWIRALKGFWTNSHPRALCNKLSDLTLVAAYVGDMALEKHIQTNYPPDHGEFWKLDRLPDIICYLNQVTSEIQDTWQPIKNDPDEKMPCCGGRSNICYKCNRHFARFP